MFIITTGKQFSENSAPCFNRTMELKYEQE